MSYHGQGLQSSRLGGLWFRGVFMDPLPSHPGSLSFSDLQLLLLNYGSGPGCNLELLIILGLPQYTVKTSLHLWKTICLDKDLLAITWALKVFPSYLIVRVCLLKIICFSLSPAEPLGLKSLDSGNPWIFLHNTHSLISGKPQLHSGPRSASKLPQLSFIKLLMQINHFSTLLASASGLKYIHKYKACLFLTKNVALGLSFAKLHLSKPQNV